MKPCPCSAGEAHIIPLELEGANVSGSLASSSTNITYGSILHTSLYYIRVYITYGSILHTGLYYIRA